VSVLSLSLSSPIISPFEFGLRLRVGFPVFRSLGMVLANGLCSSEGRCRALWGVCVWLMKEKREWLRGRYVSANWDVDELEKMRKEILDGIN